MVQSAAVQTERLIEALKALPEGWNGPDSLPVAEVVLSKAQEVLADIEVCRLPTPEVIARNDGSIELLWSSRVRDLHVSFLPVGLIISKQIAREFDKDGKLVSATDFSTHFADNKPIDRLMAWYLMEEVASA
jgi:hypothetical protein